jgi:MFS family permease
MADRDASRPMTAPTAPRISRERMALLFMVMLVTAAGNTAMQSVMPSIGTALGVADVWISLAYTWSALLWVICAPLWARRSDRRGRGGAALRHTRPLVARSPPAALARRRSARRSRAGRDARDNRLLHP